MENAQQQKGKAQLWMERFGEKYSPMVLLSAIIMLLIPYFTQGDSFYWTEKAVILLVAAAPCALVISLPIAMAAGISGAAKQGILIKGGAHLEHLGNIKIIAFDKTGTLTHGKPKVTKVVSFKDDTSHLLKIAASLEQYSSHPLAKAIVTQAKEKNITITTVTESKAIFGLGVQGKLNDELWYLGSPDMFDKMGVNIENFKPQIYMLQSEGNTVVLLGHNNELSGLIAIQDTLRENAQDVIQQLHAMNIRTVMLTGDNKRTAQRVAQKLGIDDVRAGLKPDEKVKAIEEFIKIGPTLMIGDGVNDAPALATATSGIAMGTAGTDAAIEAADIALMADDLSKLIDGIENR